MAKTTLQLGFVPKNRGEYQSTPVTRYYKDNVVQYNGSSYIADPVGWSESDPTATYVTVPPTDESGNLNAGWKVFASGNNTFTTGERVDNVGIDAEPTAGSDNLVKSGGVLNVLKAIGVYKNLYSNGEVIFTKDDISAGTIISVEFELTYHSGGIRVIDVDGNSLKDFTATQRPIGDKVSFPNYTLPQNYDKVIHFLGYSPTLIATIKCSAPTLHNLVQKVDSIDEEIDSIDETVYSHTLFLGLPIVVTTLVSYQNVSLPYTIPAGTKILSCSHTIYGGPDSSSQSSMQAIPTTGGITDREFKYVKSSYVGDIEIIIDGFYSREQDLITSEKIANRAITSEKIQDGAVKIRKVDFEITPNNNSGLDYSNSIAELYIVAPIPDGIFLSFLVTGKTMRLTLVTSLGQYPSNRWITENLLEPIKNGEIVTLKCTHKIGNTEVSVGDTVGYVVFKDIEKIKNYSDATVGYKIECVDWVKDPARNPIISSYLTQIPITNIQDKFIKIAYAADRNFYDIRDTIAELYFKPDSVIFNDEGGYKDVMCKVYGSSLYVMSYNGSETYGWTCILSITTAENNAVYELKVRTAGVNDLYHVGDTVGYIVFKDIATLRTKSSGSKMRNVIRDNAVNLYLSPMIYAYIQSKNVEIDDVIKYASIEIPSDIYIVKNNTLMLFYKSVVKSYNNNIYGIRVVCNVGKAYPKYYVLNATNTGDYNISFNIVDKDDNIISTKTSTIHVISAMSAPSANKNVLVFGASTMADGSVTGELKRRLTESSGDGTTQNPTGLGLNNITFVGRKQGTAVNVNQEATGGWSWKDYSTEGQLAYRFNVTGVNQLNINDKYTCNGVTLTIMEINVTGGSGNIRCTYSGTSVLPASGTLTRSSGSGDSTITYTSYDSESYNPFWNPNKTGGAGLDFTNYANEYCNGSIDVMIACCGYNDFNRYTPATISNLFTDYVKPFIRAYHAEFPDGKFIISTHHLPTPDGGMAANYGAASNWNWLTTAHKIWAFAVEAEKLVKESEFSSYVSLADVTSEFDCEHSYPTAQAYVNNRSSVQETVTTNGVHFTTVGAYQVSDSLYHAFNRLDL